LCYFQGFHDIVQVLLLVLGKEGAYVAVPRLALFRLRDFMLPSLSPSLTHLELLPAILTAVDPELADHLIGTKPFFALAATLTLFAHEVESYAAIARLFDFLLAEEAVTALYLFAAIIVSRRGELLEIPLDEPDMLHFKLCKLPKPLDLDPLIANAVLMIDSNPPEKLPFRAWARVSQYSVLKTSRKHAFYSITEAETLFEQQIREQQRIEQRKRLISTLWVYRKSASGIGVALIIGLVSIWVQRNQGAGLVALIVRKPHDLLAMLPLGRD